MTEGVETADLGAYKDVYNRNVYFRDIKLGKPLANPYFTFGPTFPLNFDVYRYNSTVIDVLACSISNGPDTCCILQANTQRKS
jgi:hypothetical protein